MHIFYVSWLDFMDKNFKGDFTSVVSALMANGGPHDRCNFFCHNCMQKVCQPETASILQYYCFHVY